MIERQHATVWYAPTARRRFFTKKAAAYAEAKAIVKAKYPTTKSGYYCEDTGYFDVPDGLYFEDTERYYALSRRLASRIERWWKKPKPLKLREWN